MYQPQLPQERITMSKKTVLVSKLKKMLSTELRTFSVRMTLRYLETLKGAELEEFLNMSEAKQFRLGTEYGLQCLLKGEKINGECLEESKT